MLRVNFFASLHLLFLDHVLHFIQKTSPSGFPDTLACLYGAIPTESTDESCCCRHAGAQFFTINIAIHKSAFSEERKYGAGEDAKV